jgi:cell wall-associated NlpC family hydrolase
VALAWAHTQLGVPYKYGATGPDSYDCSGLVLRAYEQAGERLWRTTRDQWAGTTRVALADLEPGDILFWSSNGQPSGIYHNALYAGVDPATGRHMRLQSPSPGKVVELVPVLEANLLPFGGRIG